jgi:hypothetical protein
MGRGSGGFGLDKVVGNGGVEEERVTYFHHHL